VSAAITAVVAVASANAAAPLVRTFEAPNVAQNESFGSSLALNGDHLLIGVPNHDTMIINMGQAHLFSASTGQLIHTFDDPTPSSSGSFGSAVAIDGDRVVIGAFADNTLGMHVGQAHLFSAATGALVHTFNDPTVHASDFFGSSVAIEGDRVVIGAKFDDSLGYNVGQAHLFNADGTLLKTFNDPNPTSQDYFGGSVAIDGDFIVIGESGDDTLGNDVGRAHLFSAATGQLLRTFNDPTPSGVDFFGQRVAIDGGRVLVGAHLDSGDGAFVGQVHLFDALTGALLHTFHDPTPTAGDQFGIYVELQGNHALVGAYGDDTLGTDVGQVHLFDATTGQLLETFNDPTPTDADRFGYSLALDGNRVVIGASEDDTPAINAGQAHLFMIPEPRTVWLALISFAATGRGRRKPRKQ
jgi:outer membrane protein assembly factor BamB